MLSSKQLLFTFLRVFVFITTDYPAMFNKCLVDLKLVILKKKTLSEVTLIIELCIAPRSYAIL